jgi:hypothetical protein
MARKPSEIISHWYHLIEGLQASPKEFYASVEQAIQKRQIPNARTSRVDWREAGPLSAKREYLRVHRHEYIFDVCGAPFGNGFFFSWWLGEAEGCLGALLPLMRSFFRRRTYYQIDTALMFQESVHSAVLEVIDGMTSARGIRALSELERKPILREFRR